MGSGQSQRFSSGENRVNHAISKGAKPFYVYSLQGDFRGEWLNQHDCAEEIGLNHSKISACLLGKYKSSAGYVFIFKEGFTERLLQEKINKASVNTNQKPFYICALNGVRIEKFCNQHVCAREYGLYPQRISACLSGKRKSTGGYTFELAA